MRLSKHEPIKKINNLHTLFILKIGSFLTGNTIKEDFLIFSRIMGLLNLSIRQ